jgi:tetratricopeptide (TPR) repeat protein
MPHHTALLARACDIGGQIEQALTALDDALQISERTGERWLEAEPNRHKGQFLLRQGYTEAAQELYRKALSIAGEQEAKLWELRRFLFRDNVAQDFDIDNNLSRAEVRPGALRWLCQVNPLVLGRGCTRPATRTPRQRATCRARHPPCASHW